MLQDVTATSFDSIFFYVAFFVTRWYVRVLSSEFKAPTQKHPDAFMPTMVESQEEEEKELENKYDWESN